MSHYGIKISSERCFFLNILFDYLPVPKREVSMSLSLGLKPLNRQMNVSLRLRDKRRTEVKAHDPLIVHVYGLIDEIESVRRLVRQLQSINAASGIC